MLPILKIVLITAIPFILLPLLFLLLFLVLVKSNIFFTFVPEGAAKAIMKMGKFERIVFTWKNHFMDTDGNIHDCEKWDRLENKEWQGKKGTEFEGKTIKEQEIKGKIFGGIFWVGIWPFYQVYRYSLRWTDLRQSEGEAQVFELRFQEEKDKDFVMLKPAVYAIRIKDAESKERIMITLFVLITMRVINAVRFLFIAPPTPLEDILARIGSLIREMVNKLSGDEITLLTSELMWSGGEIKETKTVINGIKKSKLIDETLGKWGVRIAEYGVQIKDVYFSPEMQRAMEEERKKRMLAKGRAEEISGTVVDAIATTVGKTREQVQQEIDNNPEIKRVIFELIKEDVMRKLAIERKSYLWVESKGDTTLEELVTLLKRMPTGSPEKEPIKKFADEEYRRFIEGINKEVEEELKKKNK